ncbi:FecR protein [mine drainage metagenome]|uniref:FecR protein n=1 Tax=mine drainage metagenome TaxID=410659 RepID=A0A1J5T7U9_9ZZZZ
MKKDHSMYLYCKTLLVAIVFAAVPLSVNAAAAGKVEFASGGAAVQAADGSSKVLVKGMDINAGDTILTGSGRAQVKFTDGGYMSFQPDTQFKVEEYHFNGKQDGTEKGFFRLIKGGLRAVTGLVGREHRPAYRVATPVATIGIRGSYFLAEFREKLRTHCGHGSIYVFNEQGDIILFEGQSAEVKAGGAPSYSDEELTLGARGPEGGEPAKDSQQQLAEDDGNNVFKVSEQYAGDGVSCGLTGGCGISATIANLNGSNTTAYYVLDTTAANTGGGAGWTSSVASSSNLSANFGNYTISGTLSINSSKTDATSTTTAFDQFSVSGSILTSATFKVTGSNSFLDNVSMCSSNCTLNAIGVFSGTQAEKASVGYVINGVSDGTGGTGQITGSAGFVVGSRPQ